MVIFKIVQRFLRLLEQLLLAFLTTLPATFPIYNIRRFYYRRKGCIIDKNVWISPNVRITGYLVLGEGSSIAHNCTLSGENVGIFIGKNVMIAPGVVLVAFDHGYDRLDVPMSLQPYVEAPIYIEDDVWISANCTITKGVRIGKGSIIAANSVVTTDIPPYSIAGGVPAKILKNRITISTKT
jgi:acetyltransferase-like isoleucine patch superfamily enzyme